MWKSGVCILTLVVMLLAIVAKAGRKGGGKCGTELLIVIGQTCFTKFFKIQAVGSNLEVEGPRDATGARALAR